MEVELNVLLYFCWFQIWFATLAISHWLILLHDKWKNSNNETYLAFWSAGNRCRHRAADQINIVLLGGYFEYVLFAWLHIAVGGHRVSMIENTWPQILYLFLRLFKPYMFYVLTSITWRIYTVCNYVLTSITWRMYTVSTYAKAMDFCPLLCKLVWNSCQCKLYLALKSCCCYSNVF